MTDKPKVRKINHSEVQRIMNEFEYGSYSLGYTISLLSYAYLTKEQIREKLIVTLDKTIEVQFIAPEDFE